MRLLFALSVVASSPLLAPALADTVTVGPTGSGADFDDLAAAVAAAAPGDVVIVQAGLYNQSGTAVVNKPLTILGAGSDVTLVSGIAISPFDVPLPLQVVGIGADEEVRIVGLELRSVSELGSAASGFVVQDCAGPIVFSDVSSSGATVLFGPVQIGSVVNSERVTLDGCRLSVGGSSELVPAAALRVSDSGVTLNDCELVGGTASFLLPPADPIDGAPAVVADNSVLRLSRSSLVGGNGQQGLFVAPEIATDGAAAVVATASSLFVRGGPGNELRGGTGGSAVKGGVPDSGAGGSAINSDSQSLVTATPDAVLLAGPDGDGSVVSPVFGGSGTVVPLASELATLAVSPRVIAPGSSATFDQSGEPLATYASWFATDQGPQLDLAGFLGPLVLPIGPSIPLTTTLLDAAGTAAIAIPIPAGPALVGSTLVAQGLAIAPSGTLSFSAPTFAGIQ